jgi:hypothetical protein
MVAIAVHGRTAFPFAGEGNIFCARMRRWAGRVRHAKSGQAVFRGLGNR